MTTINFSFSELLEIEAGLNARLQKWEKLMDDISDCKFPSYDLAYRVTTGNYVEALTAKNKIDMILSRGYLEGHRWD